ncbi:MAG: hypothetical protein QXS93_00510 [Candidatus Micrarchaeia archaeon]
MAFVIGDGMAPRAEIREVIEWCKKEKSEKKTSPIIELNPFRDRFSWMAARIRIAIDLPLEDARPDMVVYDSPTDALYINIGGQWLRVEADEVFEV